MRKILAFCLLAANLVFAVQYPATGATLSGDAAVSGDYVQMKEGDMSFAVSVTSAGMYDIIIRYKQDYDEIKKQKFVVNGAETGEIDFPRIANWTNVNAVANLNSGNNTIAIKKSWGWVDIMYIDVVTHENASFDLDRNLVNPNANDAAKKVFAFMQENFQKKVISGVMTSDVLNGNNAVTLNNQSEVSYIRTSSNKTPVIVGFDFMHGTGKEFDNAGGGWFKSYTDATISLAKELYERGGIPVFCWHWRDPLKNDVGFDSPANSSSNQKTTFDLTKACATNSCTDWNTNSDEYKAMIEDIDKVAGYLKELQDAGVAVLWRPIHEASGGWFWWGYKGAAAYKLLYKLIYDRLTTDKGLNNLIWIWTSEGSDMTWNPGDTYVDIIGRDFYYSNQKEDNHASLVGEFEKLKNNFGTKKMIVLSENAAIPYPENMIEDGAEWGYFMPWYSDYLRNTNSAADLQKIMNHDYVITLEDMPGWDTYVIPSSSSTPQGNSSSSGISSSSSSSSSSEGSTPILTLNPNPESQTSFKYYTLKGEPLGNKQPRKPGVYIVKEGYSVKKIVVR